MAFLKKTKVKAIVAAARHCCVCHKAKGIKVEVHHIEPKAEGGADDFDNAIVLCFDCHADAGHYNSKHPKGTKFTRTELRQARDEWYRLVREHNIEHPKGQSILHCRYYMAKQYEAITEIVQGNLSNFPEVRPLLVETATLTFLRNIIAGHPHDYRHDHIYGDGYNSLNEYLTDHPDCSKLDKESGRLSYFDTIRVPSAKEIEKRIAPSDSVSKLLLMEGVSANQIANAVTYYDGCGGVECQEDYLIRPMNVLFLAARNISDSVLRLESLVGEDQTNLTKYRKFVSQVNEDRAYPLPKATVAPGETVVIPLGIILSPFYSIGMKVKSEEYTMLSPGETQAVSHISIDSGETENFNVIGPSIIPKAIKVNGVKQNEDIHSVDLSNLYIISRDWAMGSCPHIFFLNKKWQYAGEVLSDCMNVSGESIVLIPEGTIGVLIAELEEENTLIELITIDDIQIASSVHLEKGSTIRIPLDSDGSKSKRSMMIRGRYIPKHATKELHQDVSRRNAIVCQHVRYLNDLYTQQDFYTGAHKNCAS